MDETTQLAEYRGADALQETMQTLQAAVGSAVRPAEGRVGARGREAGSPGRATVIRPGLIVGPGDMTGRFTYWPLRIRARRRGAGAGHGSRRRADHRRARPRRVDDPHAEDRVIGTFNATGPAGEMSVAEMLGGIRAAFDMARRRRV
jgi:2'-hydroxyisoflavone reductase